MNSKFLLMLAALFITTSLPAAGQGSAVSLFDGKTFTGWEGETNKTWRIVDGSFVGGSLAAKVPQNEFLRTKRSYTNFVLRLKIKLVGTPASGFVNAGVQVRSQSAKDLANETARSQGELKIKPGGPHRKVPPNEMVGYQCDAGEGWWGALYDESRRDKVLVKPEPKAVEKALKKEDWNDYLIRCEGRRIRTWLNGEAMIDYTEEDESLDQFGLIGLQVHGGGPTEVSYKEIMIEELP
jgi:hypothetical protein